MEKPHIDSEGSVPEKAAEGESLAAKMRRIIGMGAIAAGVATTPAQGQEMGAIDASMDFNAYGQSYDSPTYDGNAQNYGDPEGSTGFQATYPETGPVYDYDGKLQTPEGVVGGGEETK